MTTIEADANDDEVQCVDCGCDIIRDDELPATEQRCDTDRDHHAKLCGEDCPVICEACREHHFVGDHCDQHEVAEALLKLLELYDELVPVERPDWASSAAAAAKRMLGACKVCGELTCDHE